MSVLHCCSCASILRPENFRFSESNPIASRCTESTKISKADLQTCRKLDGSETPGRFRLGHSHVRKVSENKYLISLAFLSRVYFLKYNKKM